MHPRGWHDTEQPRLCWALTCDAIVGRGADAVLHKLVVHCRRWCEMWSLLCRKTHAASQSLTSSYTVVWPLFVVQGKVGRCTSSILFCRALSPHSSPCCSELLHLFKVVGLSFNKNYSWKWYFDPCTWSWQSYYQSAWSCSCHWVEPLITHPVKYESLLKLFIRFSYQAVKYPVTCMYVFIF